MDDSLGSLSTTSGSLQQDFKCFFRETIMADRKSSDTEWEGFRSQLQVEDLNNYKYLEIVASTQIFTLNSTLTPYYLVDLDPCTAPLHVILTHRPCIVSSFLGLPYNRILNMSPSKSELLMGPMA